MTLLESILQIITRKYRQILHVGIFCCVICRFEALIIKLPDIPKTGNLISKISSHALEDQIKPSLFTICKG